jgi:hypothetical protein
VQPPKPDRRTDLQGSWKAVYDGDCTWRARMTIRDGKMTGTIDARNAHVDVTVELAPDLGVATNLYSSTFSLRTLNGQFPNLHVFGSGYCGTAYLDFTRE